jgi:hypothetical protein
LRVEHAASASSGELRDQRRILDDARLHVRQTAVIQDDFTFWRFHRPGSSLEIAIPVAGAGPAPVRSDCEDEFPSTGQRDGHWALGAVVEMFLGAGHFPRVLVIGGDLHEEKTE